jgi:putative endonuclease
LRTRHGVTATIARVDHASSMQRDRRYYVYILGSISGTLYIGMTNNLERRVFEHKDHQVEGFTKQYNVDRLLYWQSFDDVRNAIDREKQLKRWRREKKVKLIEELNPPWRDLSREWY